MSRIRNPPNNATVKAIAQGAVPPSATVISETELHHFQNLVSKKPFEDATVADDERRIKHEMSDARRSTWNNTLEGSRLAKEQKKKEREAAEELRRCQIDEEEAEFKRVKHQSAMDDATRQMYMRDERVHNCMSNIILHNVMQEREGQIVLSARKRQMEEEREREYAQHIKEAALQEKMEKEEKIRKEKEFRKSLQEDRLKQIEVVRMQKISERNKNREEGSQLRNMAQEASAEALRKKVEARVSHQGLNRQWAAQNLEAHSLESPRQRKQQELEIRLQQDMELYALRKQAHAQLQSEMVQMKHDASVQKRDLVAQLHLTLPNKKEQHVDNISSARSFNDKILEGDEVRLSARRSAKGINNDSYSKQLEKKQEFREKEKNYGKRVADAVGQQLRHLEEEEWQIKQQQKREDEKMQYFQALQKSEKSWQKDKEISEERLERQDLDTLKSQEDEMFRKYIQSQLPSNMPTTLQNKALRSPRAPLVI